MPGVPICGATFESDGAQIRAFGRYAKRKGAEHAQAYRAYRSDFYRVYHTMGHSNYIPIVQVFGLVDGNYKQALTARVYSVADDYFSIRILTSDNQSIKHGFSYVAFKTTY